MAEGEAEGEEGEEQVELARVELDGVELVVVSMPLEVDLPELTPAEREVAQLALEGLSNREIADRRGASARTVANQLRHVYAKLGIYSRFELAARFGR